RERPPGAERRAGGGERLRGAATVDDAGLPRLGRAGGGPPLARGQPGGVAVGGGARGGCGPPAASDAEVKHRVVIYKEKPNRLRAMHLWARKRPYRGRFP